VAEDSDEGFEEVGFSSSIFADEDVEEAIVVEAEGEILQVLVVADVDVLEAHGGFSWFGSLSDGLLDEAVGEVELGGLGGGEARFELVAQRHQFLYPLDDGFLLLGWGNRNK